MTADYKLVSNDSITGLPGNAHPRIQVYGGGTGTAATQCVVKNVQIEDVTAKSVQDAPGEYASVGVGYGDDLYISNGWIDSANGYHTAGVETFTWDGGQPGYDNIYQNLGLREDLYYTCVYTISGATAGTAGIRAAGGDSSLNGNGGPYTAVLQAGSNKNVEIRADSAFDGVISAVSIKKATTGIGWSNRDLSNTSVTDNVVTHAPGALISPAPKWRYQPAATNYYLNSFVPVTQTVASIPAGSVTVHLAGTGSIALTGDTTDTVTEGSPVTYTGTGANLICTITGTVDKAQVESGTVPTSFIETAGIPVTRATDNILHDYSASVFDVDEGSLYLEIELPIDTDDLANYSSSAFFRTDPGVGGLIAYRNTSEGSGLRGLDGIGVNATTVSFTNISVGTPIQIRAYWSKEADQRALGVGTTWDLSPAIHQNSFAATIVSLIGGAGFPAKIRRCEVIDAPLLPAAHEARFKIPFYQYKEWETVWDLSSSAEFSYTASGSGVVEYDVTDPYSGLPAVKWSNLTLSDTLTEFALSDSNKFIFNTITDDPIALRVSFKYPGNSLRIVFGQSGGFGLDYIRRYVWSAADSAAGHRALITHFDLGQDPDFGVAQEWGTGNGPLNGEIDRVQFQLIGAVPAGQEVYISTFAKGGRERTKIMFGLDNHVGQTSGIYDTIFADMQAQGFKGYMGWSNGINPWDHVDDLPQTLAMQAAGWTICNHSYSHLGAETEGGGAYAFVVSDYTQQAEALESDGFGSSGRKYVIMPRNELSAEAKQAFEDMGYSYVRQKAPRYISRALVEYNPYEMGTINIGNGMAAADIEYYIDAAILLGVSLDLFTHAIGASGDYITQANWDAFMAHLILRHSEGLIDVVSKEEWDAGL
ncbi:MAG: hypothetical protein GY799_13085 [Desulfobulbaceae bacterium]|nr:hypothetical protein [Desulfobulbaceae bacterium]